MSAQKKEIEIDIDGVVIGSFYPYSRLEVSIWTVCDMCDLAVVESLERVLDDSPVALVKKIDNGGSVKKATVTFTGELTPLVELRKNHPFGAWIQSTSGGRYCFEVMLDLQHMRRVGPIGKPDRGYSWISLSLSRKELTQGEIDEFRKLFMKVCVAVNAFYGKVTENSMCTQRNVFMAKAVEHAIFRKTIPDYSREIWDVYWLNYFGSASVELWGQEKVDRLAEKYDVTRFDTGGICVQTTPELVFADPAVTGITDYEFKKHFYEVLGYNTFMHETHKQGEPGQYVPTLEQHRQALGHLQLK